VNIDSREFALIMLRAFPDTNLRIVDNLGSHTELQYLYLKSVMSSDSQVEDNLLEGVDHADLSRLQERYVALLSQFDPQSVYSFLLDHSDYRLEECLSITKEKGIVDATAYLLERAGDFHGALELLLEDLHSKLLHFSSSLQEANESSDVSATAQDVVKCLDVATSLCCRTSASVDSTESEGLWFTLLDSFVVPQRNTRKEINRHYRRVPEHLLKMQSFLTELIMDGVLKRMMGEVSFPAILGKIVKDHGKDEFGEFRYTICGMLETYRFEETTLHTAYLTLESDIFRAFEVREVLLIPM